MISLTDNKKFIKVPNIYGGHDIINKDEITYASRDNNKYVIYLRNGGTHPFPERYTVDEILAILNN